MIVIFSTHMLSDDIQEIVDHVDHIIKILIII